MNQGKGSGDIQPLFNKILITTIILIVLVFLGLAVTVDKKCKRSHNWVTWGFQLFALTGEIVTLITQMIFY